MSIPALTTYALPIRQELPTTRVPWEIDPQRAALLIHDMQAYFLDFWEPDDPLIARVIDHLRALRLYCHRHDIPVFYTAQPAPQRDEDRGLLNDMWGAGLSARPERQAIVAALMPTTQDCVLTKWRYSAFQRSPLLEKLTAQGRDQLIVGGVYTHIGCQQTVMDAFMHDIQPFLVADATADFSREAHLGALSYVAGCCGQLVMTQDIWAGVMSRAHLRAQVIPLLDDTEALTDDDLLIDFGLTSVGIMALASQWQQAGYPVDFMTLARTPTLAAWWALLAPVAEAYQA